MPEELVTSDGKAMSICQVGFLDTDDVHLPGPKKTLELRFLLAKSFSVPLCEDKWSS
jgi:hypothetical protein